MADETRTCDILITRMDRIIGDDKCLTSCDLPAGHFGPHSFIYPAHQDGLGRPVAAKRWEWEDDYDCDCCTPEEDDRCFTFGPVKETPDV